MTTVVVSVVERPRRWRQEEYETDPEYYSRGGSDSGDWDYSGDWAVERYDEWVSEYVSEDSLSFFNGTRWERCDGLRRESSAWL